MFQYPHRKDTVAGELLLQEPGDSHLQVRLLSLPCVVIRLICVSAFLIACAFCRSSSHPPTQEVLWALGAGCRNISTLQVAPSHPWSVHTPPYSILIFECCWTLQGKPDNISSSPFRHFQPAASKPPSLETAACRRSVDAGHSCARLVLAEQAVGLRDC